MKPPALTNVTLEGHEVRYILDVVWQGHALARENFFGPELKVLADKLVALDAVAVAETFVVGFTDAERGMFEHMLQPMEINLPGEALYREKLCEKFVAGLYPLGRLARER